MRMTTMVTTVAVVGMGCAVALLGMRADAAGVSPDDARRLAEQAADARAGELARELVRLERRVDGLRTTNRGLEDRLRALAAQIETGGEPSAPDAAEPTAAAPAFAPSKAEVAARRAELAVLRGKVMGGGATADELQLFLDLARSDGLADDLVAELEAASKARPTDAAARMKLADAYITKLMTVPGGPEQGVWGMKAETQWQAVLDLDEDHWEARHNLAFSWSMWPEFLGKTASAIEQYERLVQVQERGAVEGRHADVYVELSRLYERRGDSDNARAILERGRARHPDAKTISDALRPVDGGEGE